MNFCLYSKDSWHDLRQAESVVYICILHLSMNHFCLLQKVTKAFIINKCPFLLEKNWMVIHLYFLKKFTQCHTFYRLFHLWVAEAWFVLIRQYTIVNFIFKHVVWCSHSCHSLLKSLMSRRHGWKKNLLLVTFCTWWIHA